MRHPFKPVGVSKSISIISFNLYFTLRDGLFASFYTYTRFLSHIREYYKLAAPNVGLDPTPEQVKHYYIRAAERLGKGTILKDVRTDVTDRPSPEEIKQYYVRVAAEHEKLEKRKATKVDPEIIKRYYVRAAEVALS
ncbi:hypothetical protein ABKN59_008557 [Abortiporus biennis]